MRHSLIITTAFAAAALVCYAQDYDRPVETIPAGTRVSVRTEGPIEVHEHSDGRIFPATIAEDVISPDNRVLIPRGANAELIVQNVGEGEMAIDIDAIRVEGRRYMVNAEIYREARRHNPNTGAYIGGGAVFGTVLGAIVGGGKGAAAGAIAGAAAGGAAAMTRGREVRIPPESILTFRLDQPLTIATGDDRGYDRDGNHYHNGYYDRGGGRQ